MEKDDEIKGEGNSINYEARMQDTRVGRFLSVDPLTKSFPHYSPYQFAGNTPIQAIDLDGAEEYHYLAKWDKESGKIVFKLESEKTVLKKSFLGYTWIPTEEHIVVYQNSDGETTNYEFPKLGKLIQYGPTSIAERINTPASLRKFVSDANKITYQYEESANKALDTNFLSNSAENAFTVGNALIVYGNFYSYQSKTPVTKKATKITTVDTEAEQLLSKALNRQSLTKPTQQFKEKWSEGGYDYEVRIHKAQVNAPEGSNSANGTTYRVARRSQEVDSNGQGKGWEYADDKGNWIKQSELKSGQNQEAANSTHIPLKKS